MKLLSKRLLLVLSVLALTVLFSCKKKDKGPSGDSDEAAAARVVGTYKGTVDITSTDYPDATIIITKESGNKVRIVAKSGEAYSGVTPKVFTIKAISSSDDAQAIGDPSGTLSYQHSTKNLVLVTLTGAAGDVTYSFTGRKQ